MKMKETLQLGKTAFPMRGNLPNREAEWQKDWEEKGLYEQRQKLNEGKPTFVLHDGPPYANGNIHLGHSLNKISKDIIIRSKSMMNMISKLWAVIPISNSITNGSQHRTVIFLPMHSYITIFKAVSTKK